MNKDILFTLLALVGCTFIFYIIMLLPIYGTLGITIKSILCTFTLLAMILFGIQKLLNNALNFKFR